MGLTAASGATLADRRVLVLDGEPGEWLPPGWVVIEQRGDGLAERLADAFDRVGGPAFLVGMDTPQLGPQQLDAALAALTTHDAAFGAATDGGYWGIGLRSADSAVFAGIPMSRRDTGLAQRARLAALGLAVASLPPLRDVDTISDARAVADVAPGGRFAAALATVELALAAA
jgi:glycosyltransferase A (GT-A) superfamily protein (DUF2064 family)